MKKAKKTAKKKAAAPPKTQVWEIAPEQQIVGATLLGKVKAFSAETGAMTLVLEAPLSSGDSIRVKGHATDLTQPVERLQLGRRWAQSAAAGDAVGIRVADRVQVGDAVYKL